MEKRKEVLAKEIKEELSKEKYLKGNEILDILSQYTEVESSHLYHLMEEGALSVEEPASNIKDYKFKVTDSEMDLELIKQLLLDSKDKERLSFNIVANAPPIESFDRVDLPKIFPRLIRLINSADSELLITNPYFDQETMREINKPLAYAEKHGIEIKMLLRSDQIPEDPSQLIETLKYGELREFSGAESEKSFLHSKLMIADGKRAYIGSANMTSTSLGYNSEIGVIIEGDEINEIKKYFDILWKESKKVNIDRKLY